MADVEVICLVYSSNTEENIIVQRFLILKCFKHQLSQMFLRNISIQTQISDLWRHTSET